jgi:hypothetical protein
MAEIDNWLAVFKDEKLNKSLKRDGIVKFDLPFLDLESCDMFLRDSVVGYPIDFESAFYGSVSISDIEVKRKIEAGLRPLLSPTI